MAIQVNQDLLNTAKASSDNYFTGQQAQLTQTRDSAIANANSSFDQNNATEQNNINQAKQTYDSNYKDLDKQHYDDDQVAQLTAQKNGLGNSAQAVGFQQGSQARFNDNNTKIMTARDQTINDINTRISNLLKSKTDSIANATNMFNVGLQGARGDADKMYNDAVFQLQQQALAQQQQAEAQARAVAQQQAMARAQEQQAQVSKANAFTQPAVASAVQNTDNLFQQYNAQKVMNGSDLYGQKMAQIFGVGTNARTQPVMPPPNIADNQALSPWQKYKLIMG